MKRKTSLDWLPRPKFTTKANGKLVSVRLEPEAYMTLLVRGSITDPAFWPPGMQEGAAWLERIRAIEKRCIARHGHFDWEKLSRRLQDEYDSLCSRLNLLRDMGESIPLRDLLRQEGAELE